MTISDSNHDISRETCPECGGTQFYFDEFAFRSDLELPPKPWYGIDPYSDPAYHGVWVCSACGHYMLNS